MKKSILLFLCLVAGLNATAQQLSPDCISLWDGEKAVPLTGDAQRLSKSGNTPVGHFIEWVSTGIVCQSDTVTVSLRVDFVDGSRDAILTARGLSGQKVSFVADLTPSKGTKIKQGSGWICIPGKAAVAFNPGMCLETVKTKSGLRIISSPAVAVNAKVTLASATDEAVNSPAKLEQYAKEMTAPLPLPIRFILTGASTCANHKISRGPSRGWGQILPFWFDKTCVEVHNFAVSGSSIKSFAKHGAWAKTQKDFRKDAIVTIQFGINEPFHKESDPYRFCTNEEFADSLRSYISTIRAAECYPLLLTPMSSRNFVNGKLVLPPLRVEKAGIINAVGAELNVGIVDGLHISADWITSMGEEKAKDCFSWYGPGVYKGGKHPEGYKDDTHPNQYGSYKYSGLLAKEFVRHFPKLAPFLRDAAYCEVEAELGPISIWSIR